MIKEILKYIMVGMGVVLLLIGFAFCLIVSLNLLTYGLLGILLFVLIWGCIVGIIVRVINND